MKTHLPAGTKVELTRVFHDWEHGCTGLLLNEGCHGVLVDEDGDIGFRPAPGEWGELDKDWCFYLDPEDYRRITDE